MATIEAPVLVLQKARKYTLPRGEVYLHNGAVTRDGQPLVNVTRWDADRVFNEAARQYAGKGFSIQPESLHESWSAAEQDPDARDVLFTYPAKWQSPIVIPSNTPTETEVYILRADGKALPLLGKPRIINPTQRFKEGDREIVVGTVFDLPFKLSNGFYNGLEDLDPETGFLKQVRSEGKYRVWFSDDGKLHASVLSWGGDVICGWEPSDSDVHVGLRGRSTGNVPPELLESEVDVLKYQLARERRERAEERQTFVGRVEEVEAYYRSGLEQLEQLKAGLQDQK
ncbi:MAG: hypothetical protein HY512_04125 [Candidatus Aenigmarchaeota archaeon]|nr:hypothetical protein [Candidatus Aenigmarchaeota archaeon]